MALYPLNILSLCSGIGGLDLGVHRALRRLGFSPRTVCYIEREAYAASVLVKQMGEGNLDEAAVWSDLDTFDCQPWVGKVDAIIGGPPCQPFSSASRGRKVAEDKIPAVARLFEALRPRLIFLENVPAAVSSFDPFSRKLSEQGYQTSIEEFKSSEMGATHNRKRVFLLAHTHIDSEPLKPEHGEVASLPSVSGPDWESKEEFTQCMGVDDGTPRRLDRLRSLGNAVMPQMAERALITMLNR